MENLSFGEMFRLEAALDSNVREYVNPGKYSVAKICRSSNQWQRFIYTYIYM